MIDGGYELMAARVSFRVAEHRLEEHQAFVNINEPTVSHQPEALPKLVNSARSTPNV